MKRVLDGEKPSALFRELLRERPALSNGDLALEFRKHFPSTGVDAMQVIWKWRRPDMKVGLNDEALDTQLDYWLRQTGYLK